MLARESEQTDRMMDADLLLLSFQVEEGVAMIRGLRASTAFCL